MIEINTCYGGSIKVAEQVGVRMPYLIVNDVVEGVTAHVGFYTKEDVERFIEALQATMVVKEHDVD